MPEVDFDDDKVATRKQEFKFRKGWSRAGVLSKSAFFEKTHWDSGHKICTKQSTDPRYKDPMGRCYYCEINPSEDPRNRFGAVIIHYMTDEAGNPLGPMGPTSFKIHSWWFSDERFIELNQLKKQWGDLRAKDFMFNCTEDKYQRGTLTICPNAWWQMDPTFTKIVAQAYKESGIDLSKEIGKFLNYDAQRESVHRRMERDAKKNGQGPNHNSRPNFSAGAVRDAITPASQAMFGGAPAFGMPQPSAGFQQSGGDMDGLLGLASQAANTSVQAAPVETGDLDAMLSDLNNS